MLFLFPPHVRLFCKTKRAWNTAKNNIERNESNAQCRFFLQDPPPPPSFFNPLRPHNISSIFVPAFPYTPQDFTLDRSSEVVVVVKGGGKKGGEERHTIRVTTGTPRGIMSTVVSARKRF